MTKTEARHYIERINALEIEELRRLSPSTRLQMFFTLVELARKMNWQTSTPEEREEVRRRWKKIREHEAKKRGLEMPT